MQQVFQEDLNQRDKYAVAAIIPQPHNPDNLSQRADCINQPLNRLKDLLAQAKKRHITKNKQRLAL